MNDHWHMLEYENLHLICADCGCSGHVSCDCDHSIADQQSGVVKDKMIAAHERETMVRFMVEEPRASHS